MPIASAAKAWLTIAGTLSAIASLLHVAILFGGPSWYRFFGAGERMAQLAERGSPRAAIITLAIAAVLAAWSAYAFSGAGLIVRLPLLRLALVAISAIYLARSLALLPALLGIGNFASAFWIWSSLIVLVYGLSYAVGTWLAWPFLRGS